MNIQTTRSEAQGKRSTQASLSSQLIGWCWQRKLSTNSKQTEKQ